jgi:hypothetical protein
MSELDSEKEILQLAIRSVEQLQQVAKQVESKVASSPDDAKTLIRPCATLVLKLLEAQASFESLIAKLHSTVYSENLGQKCGGSRWH